MSNTELNSSQDTYEQRECAHCGETFEYPSPQGSGRRPSYCPLPRRCQAQAKARRAAERATGMADVDAAYREAGAPVVDNIDTLLAALTEHRNAMTAVEDEALRRAEEAESQAAEAVQRAHEAEAETIIARRAAEAAHTTQTEAQRERDQARRALEAAEADRDTQVTHHRQAASDARVEAAEALTAADAARQATRLAEEQRQHTQKRLDRYADRVEQLEDELRGHLRQNRHAD